MSVEGGVMTDCGPVGRRDEVAGVPRWARARHAGLWALIIWLPVLLVEPAAHATDADPAWPRWLGLAVVAASFVGTAVVGSRRFEWCAGAGPVTWQAYALLAVEAGASVAVVAASPESSALLPLLAIAGVVALDTRGGDCGPCSPRPRSPPSRWPRPGPASRPRARR
jgi:hypothetical protein